VLDARSGRLLAMLAAGAVTPEELGTHLPLVAVDERRGHAFVLESTAGAPAVGRVSMIDDRMARVLRRIAVAPFPVALAVDTPAARLFVVHSYANCRTESSPWALLPASVRRWLPFLPPRPSSPPRPRLACARHGSVTVFDLTRL
jgi:hypothetical protein